VLRHASDASSRSAKSGRMAGILTAPCNVTTSRASNGSLQLSRLVSLVAPKVASIVLGQYDDWEHHGMSLASGRRRPGFESDRHR
jgi:hypothetical protein